ncbi:hypothetical protein BDA96_09G138600 [Sorghum bicolor]|uniref:Protein argonaute N-terminal domain-containing protein n=1 Tax=Sorghum bicolor TaxID=4558 RepID=A0A921QCU9_SORBI|nr:hypothetical protein BDA96_09G138600 [Sorghum bicolor]
MLVVLLLNSDVWKGALLGLLPLQLRCCLLESYSQCLHTCLVQGNGFGRKGQLMKLITNHFKFSLMNAEDYFYHYYVNLKYEDDTPVDCKGSGRQVIKKNCSKLMLLNMQIKILHMIEKSLFSIGALPQVKNEFTVVVEDFSTGKTPANDIPGNDSPPGSDRKMVRRP